MRSLLRHWRRGKATPPPADRPPADQGTQDATRDPQVSVAPAPSPCASPTQTTGAQPQVYPLEIWLHGRPVPNNGVAKMPRKASCLQAWE
jgi:hypothetical protein